MILTPITTAEFFLVGAAYIPSIVGMAQQRRYLRENPRGAYREYWHHAGGCRRWLLVTRDTATHAVAGVADAAGARP